MKNKIWIAILLFCFVAISCSEEEDDKLIITTGIACGWCAGADSLELTSESTFYKTYNPCSLEEYSREESGKHPDWDELVDLLVWDDFKEETANTCNICVDGCDISLRVKNGWKSHDIRFGGTDDLEHQSVRDFVEELNRIRNKLAEEVSQ